MNKISNVLVYQLCDIDFPENEQICSFIDFQHSGLGIYASLGIYTGNTGNLHSSYSCPQ